MFDKSVELFPIKKNRVFMNSCGVSPLFGPAAALGSEVLEHQRDFAIEVWGKYFPRLETFHQNAARLLRADPENISFIRNAAEGLSLIANGFPFEAGDEVISYVHEYPSNHYPWRIQERRGVKLVLLPDRECGTGIAEGRPRGWEMEDLEKLVTPKTRLVAVSHVQFASSYAADLKELGKFCKARDIALVVDAAQSLGILPVYPEEWHVSAVAASGWKWLLGPNGASILYTSKRFREKLAITMAGPEIMKQGDDYLNHRWDPFTDGRKFEYSTVTLDLLAAMDKCLSDVFLRYGIEAIAREAARLRGRILGTIDRRRYRPIMFGLEHQSGILSFDVDANPKEIVLAAASKRCVISTRGGYLRIAPHFHNTDDEIDQLVGLLNELP